MRTGLIRRTLSPIVELRDEESGTALLMFAYAYLAMTSYNIIQPLTRSKLIEGLGAVNVPYVVLANGLLIGVLMIGYTRLFAALPRRWALSVIHVGMSVVMIAFWWLFETGQAWVSVPFYVWGAILGVLVSSQFWTLANATYDPRQAKRLFGFVGGGIMLGGMTGSGLTALIVDSIGTNALLVWSALAMLLCAPLIAWILQREPSAVGAPGSGAETQERGVTISRAWQLLTTSRQVQLIALVIAFGSLGATIIDQQVNMAAEELGRGNAVSKFLAQIRFGVSAAAFVIQVWLTPVVHRFLGIGFALILLPTNLFLTGAAILLTRSVWAPAVATTMDRSVRYSVDKTTREVLFLPLPAELRQEVKPFVDVTVDRIAKGIGAVLILLLVQPWALGLTWAELSYVSLGLTAAWYLLAGRAKQQYLSAFRESFERQDIHTRDIRVPVADLATIEALVEELAGPDERRVVYAIDLLASLDRHNLVTPLLLHHESPLVRARTLTVMEGTRADMAERWLPAIEPLLEDPEHDVRVAAARTLATLRSERVPDVMRPYLHDSEPRLMMAAAAALADSPLGSDADEAERALEALVDDQRQSAAPMRREAARAIAAIRIPKFHRLLIPLLSDPEVSVAREALRGTAKLGSSDALLLAPIVSLLRHRLLKSEAREVLVGFGEDILAVLAHFGRDSEEDIWVRRHIPAVVARVPSRASVDLLAELLFDRDELLRDNALAGLEQLAREHPELTFPRPLVESVTIREATRYLNCLSLDYNLRVADLEATQTLLARTLQDKLDRTRDRIYRLLGVLYPTGDITAVRWALERGRGRARASAAEFLDTLLKGELRKRVIPVVEDLPLGDRVKKANVLLRSRPRHLDETVASLMHEDDAVVSSAAIHYVETRGLWALAGDVEHILKHRDVADWMVFEAASWALASQRMSTADRRVRWLQPLPAVEVADRLRRATAFAFVPVDELHRIAASGRQRRHPPGQRLLERGVRSPVFQFLLDGRVGVTDGHGGVHDLEAPVALGFEAALRDAAAAETVTTLEPSISLELATDVFHGLLSDTSQLSHGLFRMLMGRSTAALPRIVPPRTPVASPAEGDPRPLEKILALEAIPLFARATTDDLQALASIASQKPIRVGTHLFTEGEPAAIHTVITGQLEVSSNGTPVETARSGDTIGIAATLGGQLAEERVTVVESGSVLCLERTALFELLRARTDLLCGLFGMVQADARMAVSSRCSPH